MNNKLSSPVINQLSELSLKELQSILDKFNDSYNNHDVYETWKHIAKHYTDEQITPLLKTSPEVISSDSRTRNEKLAELKSCYVKSDINVTANDIPMFRRGRKKKDKTLKDRVYEALTNNMESEGVELSYNDILEIGIINIAENTFKTLLSGWRKERGIKVKRGRKVKKVTPINLLK